MNKAKRKEQITLCKNCRNFNVEINKCRHNYINIDSINGLCLSYVKSEMLFL